MIENPIFTIAKKYDFVANYKSLYDLYLPIIGNQPINIYLALINQSDRINNTGIKFFNLAEEIKAWEISFADFEAARKKLEAMELLHTYYDEQHHKYWFELFEPLSFSAFIENQKYRQLLLKRIGTYNYEKLEYVYANNHYPQDIINITASFNQVFNDEEINSVYSFNFQNLYANLTKNTHHNIVMSDSTKQLIESYFNNYSLTLNEIEHCIYGAILHSSDGAWLVDEDLLNINFKKYINQVNNVVTFKQLKINRNAKLFYEQLPEKEKSLIFNSYKSLNAEQYYSAIKKAPLTDEEKQTIKQLKEKYALDDSLINLMIDFSLNKTFGHFNRKYLLKMAETANNLNLLNLGNMLAFITKQLDQPLHKVGNKQQAIVNELSTSYDQDLFYSDDNGTYEWWMNNHYGVSPDQCMSINKFPKWLVNCPELATGFLDGNINEVDEQDLNANTPNLIDFNNSL